jgi:uncharacterized membrane protein
MSIDQIAAWCAPWNDLFSHSKLVSGGVLGIHIFALFIGGGLAVAADRMTLRVATGDATARASQLREVRDVHGIVLINVVLLFVTGILLGAADVETFLPSVIFWIKVVLAVLLVINGALLTRTERSLASHTAADRSPDDENGWGRVRLLSFSSVFLWIATAVVGIVLSNAA